MTVSNRALNLVRTNLKVLFLKKVYKTICIWFMRLKPLPFVIPMNVYRGKAGQVNDFFQLS